MSELCGGWSAAPTIHWEKNKTGRSEKFKELLENGRRIF